MNHYFNLKIPNNLAPKNKQTMSNLYKTVPKAHYKQKFEPTVISHLKLENFSRMKLSLVATTPTGSNGGERDGL